MSEPEPHRWSEKQWFAAVLALAGAIAFFWSIQANQEPFDYTLRTASALLHGHLGWSDPPPEWLNETVPKDGVYYSVFPLGAVLSVFPVALLQNAHVVEDFPGRIIASLLAGCCIYFFYRLSVLQRSTLARRIVLSLFPVFGTWFWTNVGFGGAWQIALGFALVGEAGALYFTLVRPRPLLAGAFFALALGNRTELLLVLPVFLWLWMRRPETTANLNLNLRVLFESVRTNRSALLQFLFLPALLLAATAIYNFARFHSVFDFGYSRIPDVMTEPWYEHGLFSLYAIPYNVYTMLFEGLEFAGPFPSIQPDGFGCSIFLATPLLFLLFRASGKHQRVAWTAIAILTFALWCHGNPGGWQFAYRYAIILLPWFFLLLLEGGGPELSIFEAGLFTVSVAINGLATYLFLWTEQIQAG